MFHIILVEPEIPPNTGNIIRLSANTGTHLHLVRPLGFPLDSARMRRAGLDYHEVAAMQVHDNLEQALSSIGADKNRCFAITTKGSSLIGKKTFQAGDVFIFGRETAGLSPAQMALFDTQHRIRLPMMPEQRSLNLSNAVAVTIFEAWRQLDYKGGI